VGGLFVYGEDMSYLLVLGVIFVAFAFMAARLKKHSASSSEGVPYEPRQELFTPAERSFFGVLEQAVAGRFRVMGKIRLGDLIQPAKGFSHSQRTGAWNRIHQKHVDFVLCQTDTLSVAGVVELDDATHQRKDRSDRDAFVDKVLSTAGIPIVHFAARKGYSMQEVTAKLNEVFSLRLEVCEPVVWSGVAQEEQALVEDVADAVAEIVAEKVSDELLLDQAMEQAVPMCPACSSPMIKRQAKKGPNAGKYFWACSAFPKCRKIQVLG
jgi:very-short-patch-repair endonuclease